MQFNYASPSGNGEFDTEVADRVFSSCRLPQRTARGFFLVAYWSEVYLVDGEYVLLPCSNTDERFEPRVISRAEFDQIVERAGNDRTPDY